MEDGDYKVVVLDVRGVRTASFGVDVYHSELLDDALQIACIQTRTRPNRDGSSMIPEPSGEGYKAKAMGLARAEGKLLFVSGKSADYDLAIKGSDLDGLVPSGWSVVDLG